MSKEKAIKDPPEDCPLHSSSRIGIQEGKVYFKCGCIFSVKQIEEIIKNESSN